MGEPIDNDKQSNESDPALGAEQNASSTTSSQDDGKPDSGTDDQELGAGGTKALEAERKARRDAERALKRQESELEKLRTAQLSETERAVAEAKAAGRLEVLSEVNKKLATAEAIAKASGKLREPELAPALLGDLDGYVDEDGNIDGERIAADIDELVTARPYLGPEAAPPATGDKPEPPSTGTVPGGAKGETATTFKRSQLRDPTFYEANKDAILAAAREGRIVDDIG